MVGKSMLNYSFHAITVMGCAYDNLEYSLFQSTLFTIYTMKLGLSHYLRYHLGDIKPFLSRSCLEPSWIFVEIKWNSFYSNPSESSWFALTVGYVVMRHWPSITSCLKYASQKVLRAGSHLWLLLCLSTLNPWDWWLMPCQTSTLKYLPKFFYFGPIPAASDTSYHHFTVASRSLNWHGNFSWLLTLLLGQSAFHTWQSILFSFI